MIDGFFARAVIASLLGPVGISLGCDRAPSGPTSSRCAACDGGVLEYRIHCDLHLTGSRIDR